MSDNSRKSAYARSPHLDLTFCIRLTAKSSTNTLSSGTRPQEEQDRRPSASARHAVGARASPTQPQTATNWCNTIGQSRRQCAGSDPGSPEPRLLAPSPGQASSSWSWVLDKEEPAQLTEQSFFTRTRPGLADPSFQPRRLISALRWTTYPSGWIPPSALHVSTALADRDTGLGCFQLL